MSNWKEKVEAAKSLYDYDHAFISAEGVANFAKIFEVKNLTPTVHRANPTAIKGLSLEGGAKQASGMCAAQMAEDICTELKVEYADKFGRGSQLRECADRLVAHFMRRWLTG